MWEKCRKIAAHDVNVFINRQLIYNLPEEYFTERGITTIGRCRYYLIRDAPAYQRGKGKMRERRHELIHAWLLFHVLILLFVNFRTSGRVHFGAHLLVCCYSPVLTV